jgi:hypothetical protein
MASTINASSAGIVETADNSGILQLQTNSLSAVNIDSSQNVQINNKLSTNTASVASTITWNNYTIPAPTGSTTTFLSNAGTWITPSSGTSGTTYTAGNGLSLTGTVFSINDAYSNTWTANQTFNSVQIGQISGIGGIVDLASTHVVLGNSSQNLNLTDVALYPDSNGTTSLGLSGNQFGTVFAGNSYFSGVEIGTVSGSIGGINSPTSSVVLGAISSQLWLSSSSLYPVAAGSGSGNVSLGTSGNPFTSVYLSTGISGITNGSSASSGYVGEVITASNTAGTSLSTGTITSVISITLSAGDWDVSGYGSAASTSGTDNLTFVQTSLSTSNSAFQFPSTGFIGTPAPVYASAYSIPTQRFNVTTNTTIYVVVEAQFATGTVNGTGYIFARRMR